MRLASFCSAQLAKGQKKIAARRAKQKGGGGDGENSEESTSAVQFLEFLEKGERAKRVSLDEDEKYIQATTKLNH